MKNIEVVKGAYPSAECREIKHPAGAYYLIYDMSSIVPNLLGYDMLSEEAAWKIAAVVIGERMLEKLEK